MITVLQKQYALLQGSREVALNFIETQVGVDLNTPVPAYDDSSIRHLLIHTVNCNFQWMGFFALKKRPCDFLNEQDLTTIDLIRPLYNQVDDMMAVFLEHFSEQMEVPINSTLSRNRQVSASPLQLFTHLLTHEFHHKGQIMSMCRLLGHVPPDTDVIRF